MKKLIFMAAFFACSCAHSATVSITIPDNVASRVVNAVCKYYQYRDMIPSDDDPNVLVPNPVTKAAFTKLKVIDYLKQIVSRVESVEAANAASDAAKAKVESEINLQ